MLRTRTRTRNIMVRIRIRGSAPLTNGYSNPDPTPDSDPDLAPDPAIFVGDLQDGNKQIFAYYF
jgi:hypothetical protein